MQLQTLIIISVISFVYGQDRKISTTWNPDCGNCTSNNTLYIKADGSEDTIHQIWDFSRGPVTVILAVGNLNSSLNVSWKRQFPVKFTLSEKPKYSFSMALDKIYEYNDTKDLGYITPQYEQRDLSMRHVSWALKKSILTNKEVMLRMHGNYKDTWRSGVVNVKLDLIPFNDYAEELPHLIHTANSTLMDVSLVNLTMSRGFNSSRFAMHFVLVSTDAWGDTMHYTMRKSLDDEHTPGVFEIIEIKSPEAFVNGDGGYVQFRPVAYTHPRREVSSSTNIHVSDFNKTKISNYSTLEAFYRPYDELLVQDMYISIGLSEDGYYKKHNFTSWSFTIGYGSPPIESVSLFVICIISVGLGVPLLLAFSGILYVVIKKLRQRGNIPPTVFTDEE